MNETAPGSSSSTPTQDERTWGLIAHLSAFAGLIAPFAGNVIGPLVVWLVKREQSAFVEAEAKEALNFNITVFIGYAVCMLFMIVFIGFLMAAALFIYWLVMTILAAVKAGEGVPYRYPFALRLVK
jgi:uncharacterized Tic20 family protein